MDDFTETESSSQQTEGQQPEEELSHSDKMIGIFTEPAKTYESISKFPPRTIDWFLPVFLTFLIIAITQIVINSNKGLHSQIVDKQITRMQQSLDKAVKDGRITQEQANQQLNTIQDRLESFGGLQIVFIFVGVLIGGFIVFFILAGIYYLFAKFVLKGDGNYNSALVASGMTFYIGILQVIVATILTFALVRLLPDTSLASFMDSERTSFAGFIFSKLDVFSIWIYIVLSIGLAKMFKSQSTGKYYAVVFGLWLIGGLLIFFIAKALPFLSFIGG